MSEQVPRRRLAAILAADVAGYSRLMGEDEIGTLERLKAHHKELIDPKIAEHHGRIVKLMGDGALVEFASVVDAVSCAVEIQRAMEARNRDSPVARRIEYRIGVNVGDIIAEGSDIYGDGVNVTARLEALAAPGGICISRGAYDQVRDKLMLTFEDLGDQLVKNIARPVRVFRISLGTRPGSKASTTRPGPNQQQQSIAVLPFANVSGDPDQAFFADGITEDIITALSRFHSLKVAARNSSFAYKGRFVDARQVSRELVTDYIVEGSVRRVGNRVRITAQLIQGTTDRHIWAEKFDRDLGDIFNVQDEITRVIVGTIVHKVDTEETERRTRGGRADRDALDCYLVGRDLFFGRTRDSNERALSLIEKAIELAPGFARAHGFRAFLKAYAYRYGWSDKPEQCLDEALEAALKALSLDASDYDVHWRLAVAYLHKRQFDRALAEYEKARSMNPNHAGFLSEMSGALVLLGRFEEAARQLEQAKQINLQHPEWFHANLGWAYYHLGRLENAVDALNLMNAPPGVLRIFLAASYAKLGQTAEAGQELAEILRLEPDFNLGKLAFLPYRNETDRAQLAADLRAAGVPE